MKKFTVPLALLTALLTIVILTYDNIAYAKDCKSAAFPYARVQSKEEFKQLFDKLQREELVQFFFGELNAPKSDAVGRYLATYLTQTELNKTMRSYYKGLAWAGELDREAGKPHRVALDEICESYTRALKVASADSTQ